MARRHQAGLIRLKWTEGSLRNLRTIRDYISRHNAHAAVGVVDAITSSAQRLTEMPNLGRVGRLAGTREWVMPGTPSLIVYRIRPATVEIIRALHGAQKWPPARKPTS